MKSYIQEMNLLGIINAQELIVNLSSIGGHKVYHLEGDAWTHTTMVVEEMKKLHEDSLAIKLAYLHDIGKIYTGIMHDIDDWEYPDHSTCGGFRGILCKYLLESDPDFKRLQWYITNHIKPLYWKKNGNTNTTPMPEGCNKELLRDLAICDIKGSISVEPQTELISYLENLKF